MEGVKLQKSNMSKKPNSSKRMRVSSSGRVIKPPKKILTTSSDDAPLRKRSVCSKTLSTELERLKKLAKDIQKKTEPKRNDTSEDTENKAVPDVRSRSRVGDDQLPFTVPISKHSSQDISHGTSSNTDLFFRTNTESVSSTITAVSGTTKPLTEMNVNKLQNHYHNVELLPDSIQSIPLASNRTDSSEDSATTIKITKERNTTYSKLLKHKGTGIEKDEQVEPFSATVSNQLKELAERLNRIEKQNREILERLPQKNDGEPKGFADYSLYEALKGFPLSTVAEFKQLDSIDGKERRKQLYYHLLRLGGTKQREFLNCALKETMTDSLVCRFTWKEQKGTENFGDTKVSNILYQAAKDCPLFHGPENKTQFKGEMQEVMRATKQRYRNSTKKLLVDEPISDTEDEDEIHRQINVLEEEIAEQSLSSLDNEDLQEEYDADIEAQI